ncbi:hypothetical protein BAUCODRAFT_121320 [Baudoinia panamericana UAMH 10762]|uniref:Large ribosomal subunit protein mL38 n=1 Tax=Baudoinia panamericana (strain UAMH 10762) TaxID=717646 RepID=M2N3C1_BAUPA|nr:uncharacterized protein BAUCODRAFT_121320 [Baudoinia panamericana UAMH 10762]EMC98453.1 hypothetical protein BAUCODRAFT_121320 [Baudoinia panamericana UAMH 10762]
MALSEPLRPLARCTRCTRHDRIPRSTRSFTTTAPFRLETQEQAPSSSDPPPPPPTTATKRLRDPYKVHSKHTERSLLINQHLVPIGSRRRRAAINSTSQIPFTQLPYQCFQEARAFLLEDRNEKLEQIRVERERIARLKTKLATVVAEQDRWREENRLRSMERKLEELKILADINDPVVKKKFEDGMGDMNKPIYRHLANKQWRSYKRPLLMQRITTMHVVPDVLQAIDPVVSTSLTFPASNSNGFKRIQHGEFVDSLTSKRAPNMVIQPYDKGTRLVTIAVVNADVPDVEKDGFTYRCHFLASNIPISPTDTRVRFGELDEGSQVILPWLPAYAQKGAPYQRMCIIVLAQPASDTPSPESASQTLDVGKVKEAGRYTERHGFNLRSFMTVHGLKAVGVDLFRTQWDEGTKEVMQWAGVVGWDVEFKRKRVEPLPYKRKSSERYR